MVSMIIGVLFATTAVAGNLTWGDVVANKSRYHIDAPGTFFKNSNKRALGTTFKRFINFDGKAQVCLTDDMVYGGAGQRCVKTEERGDESVCVKKEYSELWAPRFGSRTVYQYAGDNDTPVGSVEVPFAIGNTVKVNVYDKASMNSDQENSRIVGTFTVALPKCGASLPPIKAN